MVVFYWNKWFIIVFTPGLTSCPYLALQGAAALRRRQELKEMIAKKKAELLAKSLSSFGHGLVGEQLDSTYHVAPVAQYSFMFQWSHCILSLINFWYSHSLWAQPCSRYVNMFFLWLNVAQPRIAPTNTDADKKPEKTDGNKDAVPGLDCYKMIGMLLAIQPTVEI